MLLLVHLVYLSKDSLQRFEVVVRRLLKVGPRPLSERERSFGLIDVSFGYGELKKQDEGSNNTRHKKN